MNTKQFDNGVRSYPVPLMCYLDPLSILVLPVHSSHHHEHPAHS